VARPAAVGDAAGVRLPRRCGYADGLTYSIDPGIAGMAEPVSIRWRAMLPVFHKQLLESAARRAQSAMHALAVGDHEAFALDASMALEHALKALLARRHPALIAASDFDSLLHACGEPTEARVPRHRMRTITARESLARVGQLLPSVQILADDLRPLFEVRNAAAHLGEAALTDELRIPFLKSTELVRAELQVDRSDFWGEFTAVVDAALEEQVEETRLRVEAALAAARAEFERKYGHLSDETQESVFLAIESAYQLSKYEEDTTDCPACGQTARVAGATETRWEEEYGGDYSFFATFFPGYLRCGVCDLELDGEDELKIAGVDEAWDIYDADPADFYDPSEDY
jgi:hypothetical protein